MRKDFDPATVAADGRSAAKARLFDPGADGPWCGNVEGTTLNTSCTLLAYLKPKGTRAAGARRERVET